MTKGKVLDEEIRLRDGNGQPIRQLAAGNHSFPFSFHLPGHIEESVEGLQGSFITYDLRAVCERGILAKDMSITKHVRIIRTIGPDALETGASAVSSVLLRAVLRLMLVTNMLMMLTTGGLWCVARQDQVSFRASL